LNYIEAESGAVLVKSVNNWADDNTLTFVDCPGFVIGEALTCEPFDGTSCAVDSLQPGTDDSLEPDTDAPTASPSASPSAAPQATSTTAAPTASPSASPSAAPQATSTTAAPVSSPNAGSSAAPVSSAGVKIVGWKMYVLGTTFFTVFLGLM